ncbi:MAG: fusaric acid resistance protein [Desulfovibrio sp.]|nr:fusaric acid resistance protein [Desulfovibrio sp.]
MIQATDLRKHLPDPALVLHALRTALAATLTVALTRLLGLEQGYWAVFSAILVMQADFGSSILASWARLLGTAVGAALGALAATAAEALFGPGLRSLTLAMFAAIFLCTALARRGENFRLAGVTAAIIICLHESGASAFVLGASRFLEVGLGIVVALAVSLAWPARARVILRFGAAKGLESLAGLLAALMASRMSGQYDLPRIFHHKDAALRLALRNRQLLAAARREPGPSGEAERLSDLLQTLERLAEHLLSMDHAIEHAPAEGFHHHLPGELSELGASVQAVLLALSRAVAEPGQHPDGALAGVLARMGKSLAATDKKLLELRSERAIAGYDLDEVMHFYSFYHSLRETARETLALAARLAG